MRSLADERRQSLLLTKLDASRQDPTDLRGRLAAAIDRLADADAGFPLPVRHNAALSRIDCVKRGIEEAAQHCGPLQILAITHERFRIFVGHHAAAKTRNSFKAAQAAPKPLSMLTTTTPGEQDARAQCKAVVPPAATP